MFVIVGSTGVAVHLLMLALLLNVFGLAFPESVAASIVVAMTSNFLLNNLFTYRDRRLRGWRLGVGLMTFYLACGIGAVINYSFAILLFESGTA